MKLASLMKTDFLLELRWTFTVFPADVKIQQLLKEKHTFSSFQAIIFNQFTLIALLAFLFYFSACVKFKGGWMITFVDFPLLLYYLVRFIILNYLYFFVTYKSLMLHEKF